MKAWSGALPKHLAIILDGNRRWADKNGIPRKYAIYYGVRKVEEILMDWTLKFKEGYGVIPCEQLTIYALTLNNVCNRPSEELEEIYRAFEEEIYKVLGDESFHSRRIRVKVGGSLHLLPDYLRKAISELEEVTKNYDAYTFYIPLAYDGNEEILEACRKVCLEKSVNSTQMIDKKFQENLYFPDAKPIDMLIRTGGELRLSGFMLWYLGYAELFFTKTLAEDFTYEEFIGMLKEFSQRDRRFGK
jgi:tritrans,polycis-undecaprenyl-diphosphate synthase [geranylgeranyl-diphosphate specific]